MDRRPFFPFSRSKTGFRSSAALMDISSTTRQATWLSDAAGISRMSSAILSFQRLHSFFSTMTGLHVAPTAPLSSMEVPSSCREHESFHSTVGVVRVIWRSRLSDFSVFMSPSQSRLLPNEGARLHRVLERVCQRGILLSLHHVPSAVAAFLQGAEYRLEADPAVSWHGEHPRLHC